MKVEIIDRKPTAIVDFTIPDESGLAIALTAVVVGIVFFALFLIRAFSDEFNHRALPVLALVRIVHVLK